MNDRSAKPHRPYASRDRKANSPPQGESFGWLTLSMMKSAAYRVLSPAARKVLDRIHIEHLEHGGRENGRLKVTHRDLKKAGVQQRRIPGAIAEVEALGWAKRTYRGRPISGEDHGAPTQYRLTWLPVIEPDNKTPPTNDWKGFGDDLAKARDVARKASGRTMAQRDRDSFLTPTPGQDIQSASRRGVQKNRVRGVQKNAPTNTQRGVQSPHSTGGAEEKIFEAAKLKMLAPTEPIIVTPAPPFADEPVESAENNVITLAERVFDRVVRAEWINPCRDEVGVK